MGVGNAGDHGAEVLEDDAGHVLEVGGELEAGDEEGSVYLQVGVAISLSEDNVGAIKRNAGVAVGSSDIVGKLDLNSAGRASGRGCRGSDGEGRESKGNDGLHFD